MKPKEIRYGIKHTVRLSQYESVVIDQSMLFDMLEDTGSVQSAFATARSHIDEAIRQDLERAAQCTAYGEDDTYVHQWIEEVY
jgi:hypothetical protein